MAQIKIRGLEIYACHGVFPLEKQIKQSFVFDVDADMDFIKAAESDDLGDTVSYAAMCDLIEKITVNNCFNLIEKLAYECVFAIAENFSAIKKITVTVSKPQAPLSQKFGTVSVSASLERETAYLSLGSNMGDREKYLDFAVSELGKVRGVKIKKVSSYIQTAPYGGVANGTFLNAALEVECLISPFELLDEIHRIENEGGRVRESRWGDRTLDIDVIFFGNKIIAENGLIVPHPDYINRDFVLLPLKEIAPDFVCPLNRKRIEDL